MLTQADELSAPQLAEQACVTSSGDTLAGAVPAQDSHGRHAVLVALGDVLFAVGVALGGVLFAVHVCLEVKAGVKAGVEADV